MKKSFPLDYRRKPYPSVAKLISLQCGKTTLQVGDDVIDMLNAD